MVVACRGEKAREACNTPGFLEEQRERGVRVTGAGKSIRIPAVKLFTRGGERFESAWLTA
jgi:hypothetical protein